MMFQALGTPQIQHKEVLLPKDCGASAGHFRATRNGIRNVIQAKDIPLISRCIIYYHISKQYFGWFIPILLFYYLITI